MNVLSLFDGMSCGQLALQRAGVPVGQYFASELDKHAIKVTQANFPGTIQLGDVCEVTGADLPQIDLLIGGSPCQGFSFAGKQLNFDDPRSKLFFEYVRILKETKPRFFLLENVVMKKEFQEVISEALGVQPVMIDSRLVCAQQRKRLYWSNLPIAQPEDRGVLVQSILETEVDTLNSEKWHIWWKLKGEEKIKKQYARILNDAEKAICMTARQPGNWLGNLVQVGEDKFRFLTPTECERLQTVPDNYTDHVAKGHRYKMLGNGWTVDVIAHIFKDLKTRHLLGDLF